MAHSRAALASRPARRRVGGAGRLWAGQRDRGAGELHRGLALHRQPDTVRDFRATAQKLVAISFFLLAPYVATESFRALLGEHHAETSVVGIVLTAGTLAICPGLGIAKRRLGEKLGSAATRGEGTQNLLCAYLAAATLIGLVANTAAGIWWLDPSQDYSSPRPAYKLAGRPGVARRAAAAPNVQSRPSGPRPESTLRA